MNICPQSALKFSLDPNGFLFPTKDKSLCNGCDLCQKVCPVINPIKTEEYSPVAYGGYLNDNNTRIQSSSGGAFTAIAKKIIEKGGIVFGAAFDQYFRVHHIGVEQLDGLEALRGSKYLQSYINDVYQQVKKHLRLGRRVLFTGTPCQVAGLYSYLGDRKRYANLLTCDLICHGVPSERIFMDYISYLQKRYQSKLVSYTFRSKKVGWNNFGCEATFLNGRTYFRVGWTDPFMIGFFKNLYLRPSCYNCNFIGFPRTGDLTLGDYWGVSEEYFSLSGVSVILVNTEKGKELLGEINDITMFRTDLKRVVRFNFSLRKVAVRHPDSDSFYKVYHSKGFSVARKKYIKFPVIKYFLFKMYRFSELIFGQRWYQKLTQMVKR